MPKILSFLLSFLLFFSAWGQKHHFRNYSIEEGLPQSEVYAMAKGPDSSLWLGTNGGGLSRFNGLNFRTYTESDGLGENHIYSLYFTSYNHLAIGHHGKISIYDGSSFSVLSSGHMLDSVRYMQISENHKGQLVVSGEGKTFVLDKQAFRPVQQIYPQLQRGSTSIYTSAGGKLFYIKNNTEIWEETHAGLKRLNISDQLNRLKIKSVYLQDSKKNWWVAARDPKTGIEELYKIKGKTIKRIPLKKEKVLFNGVYEDHENNIVVTTDNCGYFIYSPGRKKICQIDNAHGLSQNNIHAYLEDHEKNKWFSTPGGGLAMHAKNMFVGYSKSDGLPFPTVTSLQADPDNTVWLGMADGSLCRIKDQRLQLEGKKGLFEYSIRQMRKDSIGSLWLLTENAVWKRQNGMFYCIHKNSGKNNERWLDFSIDSKGLWIGTNSNGLLRIEKNRKCYLNSENSGLPKNRIASIFEDHEGNLWIGVINSGLSMVSKKWKTTPLDRLHTVEIIPRPHKSLSNSFITQITEREKTGEIWFTSHGNGLFLYKEGKIQQYTSKSGLSSNLLYSVLPVAGNQLWAGTQNGIDHLIFNDSMQLVSARNFSQNEGVIGIETNSSATTLSPNGDVWFGTVNGAVYFRNQQEKIKNLPPAVHLTDVRLFHNSVDWHQASWDNKLSYKKLHSLYGIPINPEFKYSQNNISFHFEAISYRVPEKNLYSWKLEGLDQNWSPPSKANAIGYSSLPPGEYTFLLKASNHLGNWITDPVSYSFVILPPWWQTHWFRFLTALIVFCLILAGLEWWTRQAKIKQKNLENEVKNRTLEVRMKNFEILSKNNELEQKQAEVLEQSEKLKASYKLLKKLNQLEKDITAHLNKQEIISTVLKQLKQLIKADMYCVGLFDSDSNEITLYGDEHEICLDGQKVNFGNEDLISRYCYDNKKPVLTNDILEDKILQKFRRPIFGKLTQSVIFIPLNLNDRFMGVISVQSYLPNSFQEYHLDLLQNIAHTTQIALENAGVFEKMQNQKHQIEEQNSQLIHLNKEKNELIGMVAHDLRNPLTSALTVCDVMDSQTECPQQQEAIDIVKNALTRMNSMISNMLDVKVLESPKLKISPSEFDCANVLQKLIEQYEDQAKNKSIMLQFFNQLERNTLVTDKNLFAQIAENLLSNALKFSPFDSFVLIRLFENEKQIILQVSDQGPGFSHEDKSRLFKKYQKLSARPTNGEPSTGLGLSLTKKYTEALQADIWLESEQGKGANFFCAFHKKTEIVGKSEAHSAVN